MSAISPHSANSFVDCKLDHLSPPHKISRTEPLQSVKSEIVYPTSPTQNRDEFTVFGEYIANELRSLKGERNLLVAKKKIQDAIFEVKMGLISEPWKEQNTTATVYSNTSHSVSMHNGKLYTTPARSTTAPIEPLSTTHTPPTSAISDIIINNACHYSNFKVDNQ